MTKFKEKKVPPFLRVWIEKMEGSHCHGVYKDGALVEVWPYFHEAIYHRNLLIRKLKSK